ncbi:SRPBCC family protein [Lacibacterium aquatile]|uniref:SRPBCC family protein n=1 Tax=Lacibacterium aquatile TaxID=1168082 RepID=A0ABW5DVN0_9PROT
MTILEDFGTLTAPDTVRLERLLPGPIDRVWSFITDSEKRRKWLAPGPMDLKVGGEVDLRFNHAELTGDKNTPAEFCKYDGSISQPGHIVAVEAPHLLTMTWGEGGSNPPSEVTFELSTKGDKVLMVITHKRIPNRGYMLSVSGGWHAHVGVLIDVLADREPRPFWKTIEALKVEYEQRIPA